VKILSNGLSEASTSASNQSNSVIHGVSSHCRLTTTKGSRPVIEVWLRH
jgi:hypothetical protein